ncbi:IclR family transcriptional regulator C-terminal domain-containing protein [Agromyces aurantiacus]|uniref:IclR family transcriptional regulator C-terminal domain-containing protein n=1 Tax=Agromyces aurantiacus TaxID=165814 RepID=A0ABV9R4D6_9MICO|nr:IclR family transcriptional regulator C-terminal domain-containing protein [Agromyces aurantiacus]MBM7503661.1 DNA-binding IclR family transcriptional regulator [Agromyces aurantiacus]
MQIPSSLAQGLRLVEIAVERERSGRPGYTASRLADTAGIERSRVSRLTRELRDLEYLERDDAQVFRAGDRFLSVAAALQEPLLRASRPLLRSIAARFPVTARITGRDGVRAILLRFEAGAGAADAAVHSGMITPVWSTGAGRALLWDHGAGELEALLADVQFVGVGGPGGARSVTELDALMRRDRAAGIIRAEDEYDDGVLELALPIRDARDAVVAAISVSSSSRDRDHVETLVEATTHAAARLAAVVEAH